MIAQSSNSSDVHKLHINQSIDLETPVQVTVESGTYLVAVFAIIEDKEGILGPYVAYVGEVNVSDAEPTTTSEYSTVSTIKTTTTAGTGIHCVHALS